MNIYISDELSPKERKEVLRYYPLIYALEKFNGNRTKASKFLGISIRCLRNIINEKKNLFLKNNPKPDEIKDLAVEILSDDKQLGFADEIKCLQNKPGWKFLTEDRQRAIIKQTFFKYIDF